MDTLQLAVKVKLMCVIKYIATVNIKQQLTFRGKAKKIQPQYSTGSKELF